MTELTTGERVGRVESYCAKHSTVSAKKRSETVVVVVVVALLEIKIEFKIWKSRKNSKNAQIRRLTKAATRDGQEL